MREIKFRAWDKFNNRWCNGSMCMRIDGDLFDDSEYVLMQYTGLKDKNGVEIYEGDIVKDGASAIGRLWEISISPKYGITFTLLKDRKHVDKYDDFNDYHKSNLEVIGNIYENPELLN